MAARNSPKTVEVNLVPGDDLEGRPGGKFLKWALSWGKRIVIITEAIVILAFLSRFWLDTTVADLADKITQEKNTVVASTNFEASFRALTQRISEVKKINNEVSPVEVYDKAVLLIPKAVIVNQTTVSPSEIDITGTSDEESLALLVAAFRQSLDFTNLVVDKISKTSPNLTVDFAMRATYIKGQTQGEK